jgi:hypothetical protein
MDQTEERKPNITIGVVRIKGRDVAAISTVDGVYVASDDLNDGVRKVDEGVAATFRPKTRR